MAHSATSDAERDGAYEQRLMKVVRNTTEQLHLRFFPWTLCVGFLILIATLLGSWWVALVNGDAVQLAVMFFLSIGFWMVKPEELVDLVDLSFDRGTSQIVLKRRTLTKSHKT
ncbi:hypothetical protein SLH49_03915 [Cognatiyoonia sp. IB215446]|uniref:hypothetical protein n=1 Tax=Cognatiyoonia sp. IB215446 TaxID=3097355 RepID=UPI002A0E605B|nr:hypothetical protein [Cognatiyoonia sp. IB215446]MDX8347125.1 hypothetical protein [Cognatiyoonia sp. IB215446]